MYWGIFVSLLALIVIYNSRCFSAFAKPQRLYFTIFYVRLSMQVCAELRKHIPDPIFIESHHSIAASNSNSWTAHKNSPVMWTHPLINMLNIVKRSLVHIFVFYCQQIDSVCMAVFFCCCCCYSLFSFWLKHQAHRSTWPTFLELTFEFVRRTFYFCCSFFSS